MARRSRSDNGRFSITLPRAAVETLDEMARTRGLSRAGVIRSFVLEGLAREERIRQLAEQEETA